MAKPAITLARDGARTAVSVTGGPELVCDCRVCLVDHSWTTVAAVGIVLNGRGAHGVPGGRGGGLQRSECHGVNKLSRFISLDLPGRARVPESRHGQGKRWRGTVRRKQEVMNRWDVSRHPDGTSPSGTPGMSLSNGRKLTPDLRRNGTRSIHDRGSDGGEEQRPSNHQAHHTRRVRTLRIRPLP